ncbi:hypothetical protein M23134_02522 [Microscilla marina ATCC 23134]|uniref:Uncharacterized protein n=1 Tax=Microscilla marina ATCC 23134 TaxID=313606 RepID=A1ZTT8_MICM2|nr:hypothetical protein M23134_02522 [Microscilla marina ATCC 23134]
MFIHNLEGASLAANQDRHFLKLLKGIKFRYFIFCKLG